MATRALLLLAAALAALPASPSRAAETRRIEALPETLAVLQNRLPPALVAPVGEYLAGVTKTPAELDAALYSASLKAADSPALEPLAIDRVKSGIVYPHFLRRVESGALPAGEAARRLLDADLVLSQWLPAARRAPLTEAGIAAARDLPSEDRTRLGLALMDLSRELGLGRADGLFPADLNEEELSRFAGRFMDASGKLRELTAGDLQRNFGVKHAAGLVAAPRDAGELRARSEEIRSRFRKLYGRGDEKKLGLYQKEVAEGRTADLYLKKVSDAVGFGVFAGSPLEKGAVAGEYSGVLVLNSPRLQPYLRDNLYLFGQPGELSMATDARRWGNLTRFINHSMLNANLVPEFVFHGGFFRLVFVASRKIARDAQLLFDYGMSYALRKGLESL